MEQKRQYVAVIDLINFSNGDLLNLEFNMKEIGFVRKDTFPRFMFTIESSELPSILCLNVKNAAQKIFTAPRVFLSETIGDLYFRC